MYSTLESGNVLELNWQIFFDYAFKLALIQDNRTAETCFSHLSSEHQNILTAQFGLDGSKRATTKKALIEKTGDESAYDLSLKAFKALKDQYYAEMLADREDFEPSIACGLGMIACSAVCKSELKSFSGAVLLSRMQTSLDTRSCKIITLRFGLDGKGKRTLKETGDALGISNSRVQQIEKKSLRILGFYIRKYCILPVE